MIRKTWGLWIVPLVAAVGVATLVLAPWNAQPRPMYSADSTTPPPSLRDQLVGVVHQGLELQGSIDTIDTSVVPLNSTLTVAQTADLVGHNEQLLNAAFSPECPFYNEMVTGVQNAAASVGSMRQLGFGVTDFNASSVTVNGNTATVTWQAHVWMKSSQRKPDGSWTNPYTATNGEFGTATLQEEPNGSWLIIDWSSNFIPGGGP